MTDKPDKMKGKDQTDSKLETIRAMCDVAHTEYDAEVERFGSFEMRTGILFAVSGVVAPLLVTSFHIPSLGQGILYCVIVLLVELFAIGAVLMAGFKFFSVLSTRPVERIDIESFVADRFLNLSIEKFLMTLCVTYKDAAVKTRKSSNARADSFQQGIRWLGGAIIAVVLYMALEAIMNGKGI